MRPIPFEKCLISTPNRGPMWKETLSRINHWCIPVGPRMNRALIMTLVVFLLFYCISSIYQVVLFDTSLYYAAPYIAWIAIGFLIALRYTTNPNAAIGLYLLIFGADRLMFEYMLVVYELSPDIIDIILGTSMMVSGALWILSKVRTRFLLLISTFYFGYVGMQFLIENIDDLIEDSVDLIVLNLSFLATSLMYLLLIVILLCNDPPYRKGAIFKANS